MLGILKELVANGWKTDNGFKPGYQVKVEEAMRKEFPGIDIRVSPHILSKMHTWKKTYSALNLILGRSGVCFNHHGDHKIDCDEEKWKDILKATNDNIGVASEYEEVFADEGGHVNAPVEGRADSVHSTASGNSSSGHLKKKRKGDDVLDVLVEVITSMNEAANTRMEYLANRIGYEQDLTRARKQVFELVGVIPGLTLLQVFDASEMILSKVEHLDFFMSLPQMARHAYVFRALDKMGGH